MTIKANITKPDNCRNSKLPVSAETLALVSRQAILSGMADEQSNLPDVLRVLSRICAGRGAWVPIYDIQHDPAPSRKFMSEIGRRKSDLIEWGYSFEQKYVRGNREQSCWRIILGPDGYPLIDKAKWNARKAGKKTSARAGWKREGFSYGNPPEPPAQVNLFHSMNDFCSFETGRRR